MSRELATRGWTVINETDAVFCGIEKQDLAVGSPDFTRSGLSALGVKTPAPPDYPRCLRNFLHRDIFSTTLGDVASSFAADPKTQLFVKPARNAKAFCGTLLSSADVATLWLEMWTESFGPSYPVLCSTPVEILSEYRVYTVHGKVVGIGGYGKSAPEGCPEIDRTVIEEASTRLYRDGIESLHGCALDFGVFRKGESFITALIEVNDGMFTGIYAGVSPKDFVDMLLARWAQMVTDVP